MSLIVIRIGGASIKKMANVTGALIFFSGGSFFVQVALVDSIIVSVGSGWLVNQVA